MMGEPNFTLSGLMNVGLVYNQGDYGYFWSSTVSNANYAYNLLLYGSDASPDHNDTKSNGFSVRCVAI